MKGLLKLVVAYIKKYRSRSFAICLSMVLSIGLIVAVGTLSKSARQANINKTKYEEGLYHVRFKDLNKEQLKILSKGEDIEKIGLSSYYDSKKPDEDLMLNLIQSNEEYLISGNSKILSGKFPTKSNEIALESWVLKNMGIKPNVGEVITIDLFNKEKSETYKLVGILNDRIKEKSIGLMEGFLALDTKNISKVDAYVTFDENSDINNNIKNISKKMNLKKDNIRKNNMLLEALGTNGEIDYKIIIVAVIVAIISGIVIYGIFNISILQRTSEYGVIRAMGGNFMQIFKLLIYELILLLIASIPIGVGVGLLGAKIFSSISGGLFTEGTVTISKLVLSFDIIMFSFITILITILIISIRTAININKISPIDAVRKNLSSEKINNKQVYSISMLTKFMSFEKALSFKNIFRNKKSFYMIVLSMSLGSTIFVVSGFYAHLAKVQGEKSSEVSNINTDYKVQIIPTRPSSYGISNKDIDKMEKLDGVESVDAVKVLYARMILDKNKISEPRYFEQKNSSPYNKEVLNGLLTESENNSEVILKNNIYGYGDKMLKESKKYLLDGKIDIQEMKNKDIALVKIPHPLGPNVVDIGIGDKVKVTFREDGQSGDDYLRMEDKGGKYVTKEFIVGGIVDKLIDSSDYYTGQDSVDLIIASSKFEEITGFKNYQIVNIDKKSGMDHNKVTDEILSITNKTDGSILTDFTQEREDLGVLQSNKLIFIYSIIAVLFVISLFNILNNVSYSLVSRTNEFGMIRAMGITDKEFKQMIRFEGLIYGITSSIFSIIFGITGQVILFNVLRSQLINPKFVILWKSYLLIIVINILIGLIATYLPSKRIKDLSIVESISSLE